jgi:hypothetical protein
MKMVDDHHESLKKRRERIGENRSLPRHVVLEVKGLKSATNDKKKKKKMVKVT